MAAKPWENRLMEQAHNDPSETTPPFKHCMNSLSVTQPKSSELGSVKVRRNNVTTRISAKPSPIGLVTRSSSSPSSDFQYDESSASSSICTSATPVSGNTALASDKTEESSYYRPSYMSLTESTKAKQRGCSQLSNRVQRQSMDEFQFIKKSGLYSNGDSKSSPGSDPPSVHFSKPLYPPTRMDKTSVKVREKENCFYE